MLNMWFASCKLTISKLAIISSSLGNFKLVSAGGYTGSYV